MEEKGLMRAVSGRFSKEIEDYSKWIMSADRFDFDRYLGSIAATYPSESIAEEIMGFRDEIRKRYLDTFESRMEGLLKSVIDRIKSEENRSERQIKRKIENTGYESERLKVMRLPKFREAVMAKMEKAPHMTEADAEISVLGDYGIVREFVMYETVDIGPMGSHPADGLMAEVLENVVYEFISDMHPGKNHIRSFRMFPHPFCGKDRKKS